MSGVALAALLLALFMIGLWLEVQLLIALKDDPIHTYGLFAVRDRLIRLVAERKVQRTDPHFSAMYENVNQLLTTGHCLSGPDGWDLAKHAGEIFARDPKAGRRLVAMPKNEPPEALATISRDLCRALKHMVTNHYGIVTLIDSHRREAARIQKENAKSLLDMMPYRACAA